MGRVQETSNAAMRGQLRPRRSDGDGASLSSKRRKTGHENEKASKEVDSAGARAESTPTKDRKAWSQEEEINLVKVLLEHKREGRMIPLQSKTATYWTDLISLLYPGEKGVTQRRLYDKVRRMHHRYNEIQENKTPHRNNHEKSLSEFWEKIFVDTNITKNAEQETEKQKVPNQNSIKLVDVSDSSEEEDDEEEERVSVAMDTPQELSSSDEGDESDEEEDDEDGDEAETSPEVGQSEATLVSQEELRETAVLPAEEIPKAASKSGSKQSGGGENENFAKERLPNVENGEKRSTRGAEQARLESDMIRSLRAELFGYLQTLRDDCMRELDEVRGQLINPARLQMARRQQELILEELSLQEKELEINRRFCRLQKEALKLRVRIGSV